MPTIHVSDLAMCIRQLAEHNKSYGHKQYFIAVDQCTTKSQSQIMKAISTKLGSGAIKPVTLSDILHEEWAEMLSLDLSITTSPEFLTQQWHCK